MAAAIRSPGVWLAMRAYTAGVSVPGTNWGTEMTVTPAGRMLVTRRKFRLAMPASMSARSNAVNSVRPSPLPATIEMALGCSHTQEAPPPRGKLAWGWRGRGQAGGQLVRGRDAAGHVPVGRTRRRRERRAERRAAGHPDFVVHAEVGLPGHRRGTPRSGDLRERATEADRRLGGICDRGLVAVPGPGQGLADLDGTQSAALSRHDARVHRTAPVGARAHQAGRSLRAHRSQYAVRSRSGGSAADADRRG